MIEATTVIVSDAHLNPSDERARLQFHNFLEKIPEIGNHLLVNGDLFEFWFEYRSVIPRRAFRTVEAISRLVDRGPKVTIIGGNHDRWGLDFWPKEVGADFHRGPVNLTISGWNAHVSHGDSLLERRFLPRLLHTVTRLKLTETVFRAIHPDLGMKFVDMLSGTLAEKPLPVKDQEQVAQCQIDSARKILSDRPEVELVVMSHTHSPRSELFGERKRFLNPGAWCEGFRYATVTPNEVNLLQYKALE
ncbi:MAG: UDP-2,3-diacylglucosamine diphosphatase [Gemmatimonadetes bacterium]|nr:UDP-2,3-diacylglucosamine diphosphatase [Gemmatimonadota bacterium]